MAIDRAGRGRYGALMSPDEPTNRLDRGDARGATGRMTAFRLGVFIAAVALTVTALWRAGNQFLDPQKLAAVPFHGDESVHLSNSDFFDLYFLTRDWHHPKWFRESYAPDQPHWGHYLMGWQLARNRISRPPCQDYDFEATFAENRSAGAVPDVTALLAARRIMGVLGVAAVAVCALVGFAVGRPLTGGLAAILLTANPLFLSSVPRAMLEAPMILACAVAVLLTALVLRYTAATPMNRAWFLVFASIAGGLAVGLASGVKLLGAVTGVLWATAVALLWADPRFRKPEARFRPAIALGIAGLAATALFYFSNPYLCSYPGDRAGQKLGLFGGLAAMFDHAKVREAAQQWGFPDAAIIGPLERIGLTVRRSLLEKTAPPVPETVVVRLASADLPDRTELVSYQTPGSYATIGPRAGIPLDMLLVLSGAAVLVSQAASTYRRTRRVDPVVVPLLWFAITFSATCYWLPLDWDRYYLLFIVAAQFVMAAGLAWPVERFLRLHQSTGAVPRASAHTGSA